MKDNKKSVIEEALIEFNLIEEALNTNTKEILRSLTKGEITSTLTESLNEDDYDIEDIEDDNAEVAIGDDGGDDVGELPIDDAPDMGGAPEMGAEPEMGGSEELGIDDYGVDTADGDLGLGAEEGSEDYEMDMTGASDEEVISVFKKLSGEDEIEVVSPSEVIIKDPVSGAEYNVKMNGGSMIDKGEMGLDGEFEADVDAEVGIDVEPEMGAEIGAEVGAEVGGEPEMDAEIGAEPEMGAELEAEPEVGAEPEMGGEPEIDDEEDELGESIVYEIELSEDEEGITEETKIGATANGNPRTATSDVENLGGSLPTGDIEGQKAEADKEIKGDNLTGGFVEKANGSGDNHASHIMEDETISDAATKDVNSKGGKMPTGDIEGQKAPIVLPEGEEIDENADAIDEVVVDENAEVVDENAEVIDEEVVDEQIAVGMAQEFRQQGTGADKLGQPKGAGAKAYAKNEAIIKKYNELLKEAKEFKKENDMFRKTLKGFRKMIGESAVYSTNLTGVVKLFIEHATTSAEKKNILNRFDEEVSTIAESKKLYKSIVSELGNKSPLSESVEKIIVGEKTTSQSSQLNETTTYVDPSQSRIIDLMKRTQNM